MDMFANRLKSVTHYALTMEPTPVLGRRAFLRAMAGLSDAVPTVYTVGWYLTPELWIALAAGAIGSTPWVPALASRIDDQTSWRMPLLNTAALLALLALSIMSMAARTYNPFIYFRF